MLRSLESETSCWRRSPNSRRTIATRRANPSRAHRATVKQLGACLPRRSFFSFSCFSFVVDLRSTIGHSGDSVKITAMLKKKTVNLTVSQTISLSALLDKLASLFGQRVKVIQCLFPPLFVFLLRLISVHFLLLDSRRRRRR